MSRTQELEAGGDHVSKCDSCQYKRDACETVLGDAEDTPSRPLGQYKCELSDLMRFCVICVIRQMSRTLGQGQVAKCIAASTSLAEHVVPVIDADALHRTSASLTALKRKPTLLEFVPRAYEQSGFRF